MKTDTSDAHRSELPRPDSRDEHDCRYWTDAAHSLLVEPSSLVERERLDAHLAACPRCRETVRPLLETDATLRDAYRALESIVPMPSSERVRGILDDAAVPESQDAALIRRIRRPVNTVLWVTVLAFTLGGLAGLAYLVYWVLLRGQ